jgi:5'(3')-deoxyribonucleotidase
MNIYIDMDDVVADWRQFARDFLNIPDWKQGEMIGQDLWETLLTQQRMYRDLKLKDGAKSLIAWLTWYKTANPGTELYFLTAIPHANDMPWAIQDKVFWAQRYFPTIPVFMGPYSHEKYMHCRNPGDILIDDRISNCQEWERAGGRAHIYENWTDCKAWLETTLNYKL